MVEARVQQQFFDCADLLNQSAEGLGRSLGQAVETVVGCLTSGGKIVACAQDGASFMAQHLASLFVGHYERVRPPLPAVVLTDAGDWPPTEASQTRGDRLVKQVQALCQPGDVLVLLSLGQDSGALQAAAQAAHDKDLTLIAFTAPGDTGLRGLLRETDVSVLLPVQRASRLLELQLLSLHCLCDAVDTQLLGEQESP